jgi:hypothetical protein
MPNMKDPKYSFTLPNSLGLLDATSKRQRDNLLYIPNSIFFSFSQIDEKF